MSQQALDLLDETVKTLRHQLAAQCSGEARYLALLSANAIATAVRQLKMADRSDETAAIDIHAIRAGKHDDDQALYDMLLKRQALDAWIADPANLDAAATAHVLDEPKT